MKTGASLSSVLVAASLFASAVGCGGPRPSRGSPSADVRERLVGAWRLASLEEPSADGKVHQVDCTGSLVFTSDGHMSVQVMYLNAHGGSPYAQDGYEASFGTYELDETGRAFTYHVQGALVRSLIASSLPRLFELTDRRLVVRSSIPDEHWRVVWER